MAINVKPYVVFDGGPLGAKLYTENNRDASRTKNLSIALNLEAQGKKSQARQAFSKCVDITPRMAYELIKVLRTMRVDYVVAPYEADAQMYHLERIGLVDGIITEDSDLLVFGAKKVIFKLKQDGNCDEIARDRFGLVRLDGVPLCSRKWTDVHFRRMAILSGCDYLKSLPGVGLKKAFDAVRRGGETFEMLCLYFHHQYENKGKKIPEDYWYKFRLADLAFMHQRIWCPIERRIKPLNPLPDEVADNQEINDWIGSDMSDEVAEAIANGDFCPVTNEDFASNSVPTKPKAMTNSNANTDKLPPQKSLFDFFGKKPQGTGNDSGRKTFTGVTAERAPVKQKPPTALKHTPLNQRENVSSPYFNAIASTSQPAKRKSDVAEMPQRTKVATPTHNRLQSSTHGYSSPISASDGLISSPVSVDHHRKSSNLAYTEDEVLEEFEFDTPPRNDVVKKPKLAIDASPSPTQRLKEQIEINEKEKEKEREKENDNSLADVCCDSEDEVEIVADSSMRSTETITKSWWQRYSFDKNKTSQSQSTSASISIPSSPPPLQEAEQDPDHLTPFSSFPLAHSQTPPQSNDAVMSSSQNKLLSFAYRPYRP